MPARQLYVPSYLFHDRTFQRGMAVAVEDGAIEAVGPVERLAAERPDAERVDWTGLAMVPGTVDTHCHAFQSLLRGFAADVPFLEWRDRTLYRYAPYLDADAVYSGSLLTFGELLRHGVTTVAEFFYIHNGGTESDEAVIQAARDVGIRLVFARAMYDWAGAPAAYQETVDEAVERTRSLAARYQGDPMVQVCPAPHSLHGASAEMIEAGHRLAQELGVPFHIHVAEELYQVEQCRREHGQRPIQRLASLGVVDASMVAVHLVWLHDDEVRLLGEVGGALAYCPSSNMFLADGVTRLPDLLAAGVRVGLGTDGPCSNNRASVFEEMRMAALLQKVHRLDATALSAMDVFEMGTCHGGKVLGLPVGEIAPGLHADFVGVDLGDLSLQPAPVPEEALLTNIVYAMQASAIARVVVAGRQVACHGRLQTVPEAEITRRVQSLVASWPRPA